MKAKYVFSYIYKILREKNLLTPHWKDNSIKTNKVLYFAELFHRIFFGEKLIDEIYIALPQGPAIDKQDIDYENLDTNYTILDSEAKKIIDLCLKTLITTRSPAELVELSHGEDPNCPLVAWKIVSKETWGTLPISDELINQDSEILKDWIFKVHYHGS